MRQPDRDLRIHDQDGVRGATAEYDAFISYSHALDGALAPALQTGLERFAKPWYRPRALRVFRDTTSLAANPGLWSAIEKALASSAWLVLMASPKAARSPWVNREVEWWLANKPPKRVLVVLTEGEFTWAEDAAPGDQAKAALPPALRGAFAEKPRWVDLRWLRGVDQVAQSNPRLRACVADVAAAVHGVPKDELVGEHIRQHRRT
ncbi:MAG: TIR domain-containing protein, partial [Pseudonocardiaceae bacterium]